MSRQIVLDTETTGLLPAEGHRITEIGCLELVNRQLTGRKFHTYVNPERDLDEAALRITGLTREFLSDKPTFVQVADSLVDFLDDSEIIIHNAPFDLSFLNAELTLIDNDYCPVESHCSIVDTLVMARRLHPGQRNNLDALCARYQVDTSAREYHGALLDADLLAKVYLAMTAGQTSFSFSATPIMDREGAVDYTEKRTRAKLRVIQASSNELALHEKRIKELLS